MTTSSKPRGPYAKTAAKREAIAEAARAIVLQKGHRGLTTAEVAERAGMSERAMLYHFPTRDHLLIAAIERQDISTGSGIPTTAVTDELVDVPTIIARRGMGEVELLRLFGYLDSAAQDPEHPAHDYMTQHTKRSIEGFATLVRHRQEAGLAHPDIDPTTAARQIVATWRGLQSMWLADPGFDLADEVSQAFRRLTGQPTMEARSLLGDLLTKI